MGALQGKSDDEKNKELALTYQKLQNYLFSTFQKHPSYIVDTLKVILMEFENLLISELKRAHLLSTTQKRLVTLSVLKEIALILSLSRLPDIIVKTFQLVAKNEFPETTTQADITDEKEENIAAWKEQVVAIVVDASSGHDKLIKKACKNIGLGQYDPKYALIQQLHSIFGRYTNDNKLQVVRNLLGSIALQKDLMNLAGKNFYGYIDDKLANVETYEQNYYKKGQGCFSFFGNAFTDMRRKNSTLNPLLTQARQSLEAFRVTAKI